MFSGMTIEHGEKALSSNVIKVNYERVGIFHCSSCTLVLGDTNLVCGVFSGVSIQDLQTQRLIKDDLGGC
jgi:hypothetical protein